MTLFERYRELENRVVADVPFELTNFTFRSVLFLLDFTSKKIRININQAVRAEQKQESTDVMKTVEEDRRFIYQAMLVRVMKSRKVSTEG